QLVYQCSSDGSAQQLILETPFDSKYLQHMQIVCERCQQNLAATQHLESLLYCFGPEFAVQLQNMRKESQRPLELAGLRHDLKHRLAMLPVPETKHQAIWQNLVQLIDSLDDHANIKDREGISLESICQDIV